MTTSGFVLAAMTVQIKMASQIFENHTVTFGSKPDEFSISTGGSLTFTPANWNTNQPMVVTPLRPGTIFIPYTITSPYTQKVKKSSFEIFAEPFTRVELQAQSVQTIIGVDGFPSSLLDDTGMDSQRLSLLIPTIASGYTVKLKLNTKPSTGGGIIAYRTYVDGVGSGLNTLSTVGATVTLLTVGPSDIGKSIEVVFGNSITLFGNPNNQIAETFDISFDVIDNFNLVDEVVFTVTAEHPYAVILTGGTGGPSSFPDTYPASALQDQNFAAGSDDPWTLPFRRPPTRARRRSPRAPATPI